MGKILVIGGSGLIGSKFVKDASNLVEVESVDEKIVDITSETSIEDYFVNNKFDSVVNFAAIADVDGAEKQRGDKEGLVWKLNVEGPQNLAKACKRHDKFLVQISTDFVFPGTKESPGPYEETEPIPNELTKDLGWYGWTKNRAEEVLRVWGGKYAVVRIAYPFYAESYEQKLDFVKNYLKLFDEGKLYPIFYDQIFTPILVDDLIKPLVKIADEGLSGIYHIVSSNEASMSQFVEYLIKKARNKENVVKKASMEEFLKTPGRTPRPIQGGLKTEKTQTKLEMKFRTWQEMVEDFVNQSG